MSQQPPSQSSNIVVTSNSPEPNILLRVVWFVFVGWVVIILGDHVGDGVATNHYRNTRRYLGN